MLHASYTESATAHTSVSETVTAGSALAPEAAIRVNAAVGWLGHALNGRTTIQQARSAVDQLLDAAQEFQP